MEVIIRTDRANGQESGVAAEGTPEFRLWVQRLADFNCMTPFNCLRALRDVELATTAFVYRLENRHAAS